MKDELISFITFTIDQSSSNLNRISTNIFASLIIYPSFLRFPPS
ncbi:hypothetical protein Hgul01_03119 [Herpetosiphon gulosus]|uniref:Uncharacterized protein n=1 Tax=Herpetosiphon gulosus TaxID=1973496 RepID=A0ABP9X389_9CHLR